MAETKKIKARKLNKNIISVVDNVSADKGIVSDKKQIKEKNKEITKKVKSRKIRMSFTAKEEQKMDHQIEIENNVSIGVMVIILVLCFAVGISLGYALYRIAINSSSAMFIVKNLFS